MRATPTIPAGDLSKYWDPRTGLNANDPKEARRKIESNFFLTINTNKTSDDPMIHHSIYSNLERVLKKISQEQVIASYLKYGPADNAYANDQFSDVVQSLNWSSNVEEGDVLKRVHAHIWLTITHYSQLQINVQMLMHIVKREYNAGLGDGFISKNSPLKMTRQPYVHVKLLPQSDWTDVMRQYIHKGMTG